MLLKPVSDGPVTTAGQATGTLTFESRILGGALISGDSSTEGVVTLQQDNSSGKTVFSIKTKQPMFITGPIQLDRQAGYYTVSGSGGEVMFFEWVS